jgi:hypothetical protein
MSAMNVVQIPPKGGGSIDDEIAIGALQLVRCFFQLRTRAHRRELIVLAEQIAEKDARSSAEPTG